MAENKKKPVVPVPKKKTKKQGGAAPKVAAPPLGAILPDGPIGNLTFGAHPSEVGQMQREMSRRARVGAGGPTDIGYGVSHEGIAYANDFEASNSPTGAFAPGGFADRLRDFMDPGASKRMRAAERFKAEQEASRIPNRAAVLRGDLPAHRTLDNPRPDLGRGSGGGRGGRGTFARPARPDAYPFGESTRGVNSRFANTGGGQSEPREANDFEFPAPPRFVQPQLLADTALESAIAADQLKRQLRKQRIIENFQDDERDREFARA